MSRRHLTLAVVALASFVVAACSSSPTAPVQGIRTPEGISADSVLTVDPVTGRSIWASSNG